MGLRTQDDGGYHGGMNRDTPSWLLDKGEVYDALNVVFDRPGIARQRGGSTAIFSGAQTAYGTMLGFCYSKEAVTPIEELYAPDGKNLGNWVVINKTTGVTTALLTGGAGAAIWGRPVRHFGFVLFLGTVASATNPRYSYVFAGGTVPTGPGAGTDFISVAASSTIANNPVVTMTGADVTTGNVVVGSMIAIVDGANTNGYFGRVTSVTGLKTFTVWPVPTVAIASPAGGLSANIFDVFGAMGTCGASFQNRLLVGAPLNVAPIIEDRRIRYSILPGETTTLALTGTVYQGAWFMRPTHANSPANNFFTVPGGDPIIAMEPVSDNELLILTSTHPVIFRGNLVTQTSTTSQQVTFDVSEVNQPYGCLSDLTVHRTSRGIVWAGSNGIYAYTGGGNINDLTKGKIATYWRSLVRGSSFAIHGAAYVRGHYIISGTSGGSTFSLACNMDNLQWGRLSGVGTDIFFGVPRPSDPSQVFALRWWDTTAAAPSMTNGQTVRIESFLDPYTVGTTKTDADAAIVPFSVTSRVLTGDIATQKVYQRCLVRYQAASPAAAVFITAQSKIDAADIVAASVRSLGAVSNTEPRTITNVSSATPMVVTTSVVHGLQDGDFVDIEAVIGQLHANGRWRVTVITTTTFSLNGSTPFATGYVSGGTMKKVTEQDFMCNTLDQGQGVSFVVFSSGACNNFELHGLRIAYFEQSGAVVSA